MTETSDPNFRQIKSTSTKNVSYPAYAERWAIIVGISQYKNQSLNLKYADRDAEELYKLLLTPSGGAFEADHIIKLTNEDATTAKITQALRSFLKKPAKEDIVLIYFACHGAPDLDRPSIVYLITHDTEPDDISGTALPMREIDLSLKENLLAERVIVLADTCHSAAIGGGIGRRNIADNTAVVNRYLEEVSKARGGIALLTSAEANEVSFEDTKWGGGHGVFTYYLLKGMRGEADTSRNGAVSVGELFEYVRENVKKATDNKQHPSIGANSFDRNLPITNTAGISAQQHYEVGCELYRLALLLNDRRRFESAIRQLQEALRFAEHPFPEANLQLGLALMAANNIPQAIKAFLAAMKANTLPDAAYYLGIAYAKQGKYESALKYLQSFLTNNSQDKKAPWLTEYIACLSKPSNKHALLIGIANYHPESNVPSLQGPGNDIKSMRELLTEKYAFPPDNITTLADADATREGILKALGKLQSKTLLNDIIVIYFGGHATPDGDVTNGYLLAYDSKAFSGQGITVEELHTHVNSISGNTTLIIDADPRAELVNLARQQGNYTLFLCASPNQLACEYKFEDGRSFGAFTYNFIEELRQSSFNLKQGQLIELITNRLQLRFQDRQTPLVIGDKNEHLFSSSDYFLKLFDFSQRRNYFPFTLEHIERCYANFEKNIKAPFPEFYHSLGRAFLEKGNYFQALHCLQTAIDQSGESATEANAIFALGIAQLRTKRYQDARSTFQRHLTLVESQAYVEPMQKAMAQIEHLETDEKYALLVGIDNYIKREIPKVSGAVNDVRALQQVLISKYGFQEANITLLLDIDATREAIIEEFKKLVNKGQQASALFYFAGNGSFAAEDTPTIISVDGRTDKGMIDSVRDIALNELVALVEKASTNLITIIDAGWNKQSSRYVAREETQSQSRTRGIIRKKQDSTKVSVKIGRLSIYQESIEFTPSGNRGVKVEAEFSASQESIGQIIYGDLTRALIKTLQQVNPDTLTYRQLINAVKNQESLAPYIVGNNLDEIVFSNAVKEGNLQKHFERISQEPVKQTIPILQRLIEQRNDIDPEGYLNLGVIYYVLGEYDKSIKALDKAVEQQGEQKNADAHYYIGRALLESNRDFAWSVSELRQAKQQDPENPAIYYYLGQAIRALVERETLVEAENAFQNYLNAGAPLGQEEEVRQFLKSRENNIM